MMFTAKEFGLSPRLGAEVKPLKTPLGWHERGTILKLHSEVIDKARELGWIVDTRDKTVHHNGPTFTLVMDYGYVFVWKCREFWQCADYIDNRVCNHRPMNYINDIIERESKKAIDSTP